MAVPSWFDEYTYLQSKLNQLISAGQTQYSNVTQVKAAIEAAGMSVYQHFEKFSLAERTSPNTCFNTQEYLEAKAAQLNTAQGVTTWTADKVALEFQNAGFTNAYEHFSKYGWAEGVNPSNSFDVSSYLEAKAAETGKTVDEVKAAFEAAGLDPIAHYETYGKSEGITVTEVPADEQVTPDSSGSTGQTFTLTKGLDNIQGTSGNDTIIGSIDNGNPELNTLSAQDIINGGAGTDTLKIAHNDNGSTAAAVTLGNLSNVEVVEVESAASKGVEVDTSTVAGVTNLNITKAAGNIKATAGATTDVTTTVAGAATTTITGGKAVSVTAGTGAVTVAGDALTSVTVKGGATTNAVTNTVSGTGSTGTTLTTVTFDGQVGSASGNALTNVNLKNLTAASNVNVTNASTAPTLNLALDAVGYNASGSAVTVTVTDGSTTNNIKTVNVTTASKSNVELNTTAATAVTAAGAGALALDLDGTNNTAIASFDGSAATGNLTLSNLAVATATVKTGSGNDAFTVLATAKATVDAGAGNDTVTLNSALAAGSTVNLGAGNDTLLKGSSGSVVASTTTATTVIDGGDGTDTVAANFITVGNAAQFKNFEKLNLDSTSGLDLALLAANNTLTGLTMSTASTSATYQNVSKDFGLTVDYIGDNSGDTNTLQLKDATGTADAYTITFAADNSAATSAPTAANVQAGKVITAGIENYNIVSGGAKAWNEITLGANTSAQTVTITGAANLDLDFNGAFGSTTAPATGVTLIDGSAATGKLDIDTTNVVAATAGLTVKGGSANDTITLAQKATVDAGAGDDTITVSSAGGTITTGAGKDMVNVKAAVTGTSAPVITTVTDFTVGSDKLTFATQGTDAFTTTKIDVSTATALFGGTVNALDLAIAAADSTNGSQVTWFQYNGDTYVVQELGTDATVIGIDDIVVKLTGLVDLSTLTAADFNFA